MQTDRRPLLDPEEVATLVRQSARRTETGLALGLVAMFATFGLTALFYDPVPGQDPPPAVSALSIVAVGMVGAGLFAGDRWARKFRVVCPRCDAVIESPMRAKRSRRCPHCDRQVFPGRVRGDAVLRRHAAVAMASVLRSWCWAIAELTIAGAMAVVSRRLGLPEFVWKSLSLLGGISLMLGPAVPYVFIRTRHRRYVLPSLLSVASISAFVWDFFDRWPNW